MPSQSKNTPATCVPDSVRAEVTELKCELAHSDRNRDAFISPPALWPVEWQVTSSIKRFSKNERLTVSLGFHGAGLVGDVRFGFIWTECFMDLFPSA